MPTFAELMEEERAPSTKTPSARITPQRQAEMDRTARDILVEEFQRLKSRGADTSGIEREMQLRNVAVPTTVPTATAPTVAQAPSKSGTFADFMEQMRTAPTEQAPQAAEPQAEPEKAPVAGFFERLIKTPFEAGKQLYGTLEAIKSGVGGAIAVPASAVGQLVHGITTGQSPLSAESQAFGGRMQERIAQPFAPKTEAGRAQTELLQQALEASKIPPVGVPGMEAPALAGVEAGKRAVRMPIERMREMYAEVTPPKTGAAAAQPGAPGSVGAAGAELQSRINEVAARLPESERQVLLQTPPEKVDLAAAERRAVAHKFDMELTKGEARQDASLLGDEFNAKKESPEMQRRLDERNTKLFAGLDRLQERSAPDIYSRDPVDLGQKIIDVLQAKDEARQAEISGLYKRLEEANGGQFPIDTGALLDNIKARLAKKLKSRYAPGELMGTIEDAAQRGSLSFEDFEHLRTTAANELRSSKDGNRRMAVSIIRDELENIPLTEQGQKLKALADAARDAAKKRFDLIDENPAYKAAVRDSRSAADIEAGFESVDANKFLAKFLHGDTTSAATGNVRRLIAELADSPEALQALKAGTIEHLRESGTLSGNAFGQAKFNKRLAALERNKKLEAIFHGDETLQDLKDLGQLAAWTEHRRPTSGANVSETANVLRQHAPAAAELVGTALGAPGVATSSLKGIGIIRKFRAEKQRQTELRKMVEPGAGIVKDE